MVVTGLPGSGKTTLARELAATMPAVRMCPDDWMFTAGIDVWDGEARAKIEAFQFGLAFDVLRAGGHVVIEWGVWSRAERDALRLAARAIGAPVELRALTAPVDVLFRRICERDAAQQWGGRPITREELEGWSAVYETPTPEEVALFDPPLADRRA